MKIPVFIAICICKRSLEISFDYIPAAAAVEKNKKIEREAKENISCFSSNSSSSEGRTVI